MTAILFVDDKPTLVHELVKSVRGKLNQQDVDLRIWIPKAGEEAKGVFVEKLGNDTVLVVTDHDLTEGQIGLFGSTIVEWCQQAAVPVADYSRALGEVKKEPDLFEIRVPRADDAASFIAGVFRGFDRVRNVISADAEIWKERSPAAVLARVVSAPNAESDFALYSVRLASASGALTSRVMEQAMLQNDEPSKDDKRTLLAYIVGHLLLNAVLRYPGPILSLAALKAYLATSDAGNKEVLDLFAQARYDGPFSDLDTFHWLSGIDEALESLIPDDVVTETNGELHREALERKLEKSLHRHACPRCSGQNGGFFCPFTNRTVCLLSKCSVGSNSWIPQGARLCRIERDFFDEWSPILGL